MTDAGDRDRKVDRLLHDAEHADSGAMMAGVMRDHGAQRRFIAKRDNLVAEARALDPKRESPSWVECRLTSDPNAASEPHPQPEGG
jgi:hypothetical protein